jgi:glycosyltransferase involved in cell wall biosynthesis
MRVLLTSEARFERTPDGVVWGAAPYGCANWQRYLDVFTAASVLARVADVRRASPGYVAASCSGIRFQALPAYSGLSGFFLHFKTVREIVRGAVDGCEAVIVRSPSPIAALTAAAVLADGRSYGAQIVGDPAHVFSAGASRHPLRAPIRRIATTAQKRLARDASAVLYVTRQVLQRDYPTRGQAYSASDVCLDDSDFERRISRDSRGAVFTLVTVGSLEQPYKGTDILLDAVARLRRGGAPVHLRVVGTGRLLPELRRRAQTLGLDPVVAFDGQVDRNGVREILESADLFVLPSRTEGLPRALLEAMAQGLPAIASDVGGIPELLTPDCLVPPGNPQRLADAIARLISSGDTLSAIGLRNRQVARQYHEQEQNAIRKAFLRSVAAAAHTFHEAASA